MSDDSEVYEVKEILDSRKTRRGKTEYYVSWEGYDSSYDTWEPEENLANAKKKIKEYLKNCKTKTPREKSPPRKTSGEKSPPRKTSGEKSPPRNTPREKSPTRKTSREKSPTTRHELLPGQKIEKIVGMHKGDDGLLTFLVSYKDCEKPESVSRDLVLKHCPQILIDFYESRISFD